MRHFVACLFALMALCAPSVSFAEGGDTEAEQIGELANGLRYVILRDTSQPEMAEFYFVLNAGWLREGAGEVNYAHLMEHLLAAEAKQEDFPELSGERLFRKLQGRNPQTALAQTGLDRTIIKAPIDLGESSIQPPLDIFRSYFAFLYTEEAAQREAAATVNEALKGGDLYFHLMDQAERAAPWMGFALSDVTESMAHVSLARLREFHRAWYRPDLAYILIRGDIDVTAAEIAIKRTFSDIPSSQKRLPAIQTSDNPDFLLADVRSEKLDRATVKIQFREKLALARLNTLFDDPKATQIAVELLNEHMAVLTRRYDAIMQTAFVSVYPSPNGSGIELSLQAAGCKPDRTEQCINGLMDIFQNAARQNVDDQDLSSARKNVASNDVAPSRDSWGLHFLSKLYDQISELQTASVGPDNIRVGLDRLWKGSTRRVELWAPVSAKVPTRSGLDRATSPSRRAGPFLGSRPRNSDELSLKISPTVDRRDVAVRWEKFGGIDIAVVSATERVPISIAFPSSDMKTELGMRVSARSPRGINSLPEDLQAPAIHMSALVASNGLGALDRYELEDYSTANHVGTNIFASPFNVILTVSAQDRASRTIENIGQLLAAAFQFEPSQNAATDYAHNWLAPQDAQGLIPAAISERGIARSKNAYDVLKAYRALISNPADFVFEVSAVPVSERENIARTLGSYLLGSIAPAKVDQGAIVIPADIRATGLKTVQTYLKWAVTDRDASDYDRVDQALSQILSARLFARIRLELRAAYSVSFGASNLSAPPVFTAFAQFDAEDARVDELVSAALSVFADFAAKGPTAEEMAQIRSLPAVNPTRSLVEFYMRYRETGTGPPSSPLEPTAEILQERARLLTRKNLQVLTTPAAS